MTSQIENNTETIKIHRQGRCGGRMRTVSVDLEGGEQRRVTVPLYENAPVKKETTVR